MFTVQGVTKRELTLTVPHVKPAAACSLLTITGTATNTDHLKKKKLHGLSPRANYTDRAAAAGRRS